MSRDSTIIPFRQPDTIDDPLTELAREGARRMLAGADCRSRRLRCPMEGLEIAGWARPRRPSRPWAATHDPDRGRACRGQARQGARPGRGGRGGKNPLQLVDPAEMGAADQESRCAVAGSLFARGVDRRLPGGACRSPGQGRAQLVAGGDRAADGGVAGRLRRLASARSLGAAIRLCVGGRGLPAGAGWRTPPNACSC